jgi:hypothetical protein
VVTDDGQPMGKNPIICKLFKAIFNLRTPKPRYTHSWDVSIVLKYLKSLSPMSRLSLKDLTLKLLMLVAVTNPQRAQSFHALSIDNTYMFKENNKISFILPGLVKQSRPGYHAPLIELKQYTEDIDLCAFSVINEYLKRTNELREKNEHKLFISFTKPHKAVSKDTIRRWILIVLTNAGIDTSVYKAHSLRHAVTSKANSIGIPLSDILNKAGWTGSTMFEKFYKTPVLDNDLFSDKLLKTIE